LNQPDVLGQVFNLTDGEFVSKRNFIEAIAEGMDIPKPTGSAPLWLARTLAFGMERWARWRGAKQPPLLTQARIKFLGLNLDFSIEKAKRELGYLPKIPFHEAIRSTMAWYRQNR
jgi:nucleoside-diphosphate-sugar epimerase